MIILLKTIIFVTVVYAFSFAIKGMGVYFGRLIDKYFTGIQNTLMWCWLYLGLLAYGTLGYVGLYIILTLHK